MLTSIVMKGEGGKPTNNGGWIIRSTREIFENPFFAVFEDDVIKPDGSDGKYATVRFVPGASVLAIDGDENVYLTRQFRYAIGRHDLQVVAGSIEGEGAMDAAKRELKEELGIEAARWLDVGTVHSLTSTARCESRLFIARDLTFSEQQTEGTEEIEPVKLKLSEAFDMVTRGEITDGDTCLLIMKAVALEWPEVMRSRSPR